MQSNEACLGAVFDDSLPLPTSPNRAMRSPRLYLSTSRNSSGIEEDPPSPGEYFGTSPQGGIGGAGVKRNKSLMQKIKAMVGAFPAFFSDCYTSNR